MIARITTTMKTTPETMWEKISQPATLIYVSSPVLRFVPIDGPKLDTHWHLDGIYRLKLYFLHFIPMGNHTIRFAKFDQATNTIISHESGTLAKVWHHKITFKTSGENRIDYCDEVEIKAGLLTPFIWGFAQLFYRHRQKRWAGVLERNLF
ncbi:MAG: hypothetical protein H8E26_07500 [FCB group bacterium]|nr:hypothetical protein [FCB group bacterium]MBL7120346.1 hypothetical protein [Candidatus Neomarinimicrobiota bacterium]